MGAMASDLDGSEIAGVVAGLSDTVHAVVRHNIAGNRAVLAGRRNNLYHIAVILGAGSLALRQAHSLADDFPPL